MLVRARLHADYAQPPSGTDGTRVRLPSALKRESLPVRNLLLRGLSASRWFALGDRVGALSAAQRRSGRRFRLDVRQRVIVKALVSRHAGSGRARGQGLARHLAYLGRSGAGIDGAKPSFFDRSDEGVDAVERTAGWAADRHHFRLIVSPEHGDRIADLKGFTREVMGRVSADLGAPELAWIATCHFDTDQPHAHVLIRGRRGNGRDLVIPRDYIAYGIRGRAQEVAQERLGDLSRADAERRIWRETQASYFTAFDRRLLQAADAEGFVDDGVGANDAWAALTRGRLRHLEALGLAARAGRQYRLDPELERKLRVLQLRRDIMRSLHQHRLESGRPVRELGLGRVRGRVVARGTHDELGAAPWVIVEDRAQVQHYARLGFGEPVPKLGSQLTLVGRGANQAATRAAGDQARGR